MSRRRLVLGVAAALAFALACGDSGSAAVASTGATPAARPSPSLPPPAPPEEVEGSKILVEAKGDFSDVRIRQQGTRRSMIFVRERGGEFLQTVIDLRDPDRLAHAYAEAVAGSLLVNPSPARILIVGLGGGTLIRFFHRFQPEATIDAVEIDPVVVHLAARWFGIIGGPRLKVITADGVRFIADEGERYDLIVLDAFLDPGRPGTDSTGVPRELRGLGFLQRVRDRLNPGGVAAFNIHFKSGYREHVDAIAEVFPQVHVARVRDFGQRIVYAAVDPSPAITAESLAARARELDGQAEWGFSFAEIATATEPWVRSPAAGAATPAEATTSTATPSPTTPTPLQ